MIGIGISQLLIFFALKFLDDLMHLNLQKSISNMAWTRAVLCGFCVPLVLLTYAFFVCVFALVGNMCCNLQFSIIFPIRKALKRDILTSIDSRQNNNIKTIEYHIERASEYKYECIPCFVLC